MFPRLTPTAPMLRRGPGEVQVGLDPTDAVVLSGLTDADVRDLASLDGSREVHTGPRGVPTRLGRLVDALTRRGLVVDALAAAAPPARTVLVDGDGPTSRALAAALRQAGLRVRAGRAAYDAWDLAARSSGTGRAGDDVGLVVRVASGALSPTDAAVDADVPTLPVVVCTHSVVVGPLLTPDGPCLRCLDLTRCDLDPAWVTMLAQIDRLTEPDVPVPLVHLATAAAAHVVHTHLTGAGGPVTDEVTSVEWTLTPPRVVRRRWAVHPRCPRHAVPADASRRARAGGDDAGE